MSENLSELLGRKGVNINLFEELGITASEGTVSEEEMDRLAKEFLVGKANVYGSVSFYDFLKPQNQGKKVYICNGSACLTAGTQKRLKEQLLSHYNAEEIGEMCCMGRCHENASFHTNGINYSGKAIDQFEKWAKEGNTQDDAYHVESRGTAILTSPPQKADFYSDLWDEVLKQKPEHWLLQIKESGLRGRGGAWFPIAVKLEACRKMDSELKFIVCNADEGDPGAYSDRYLCEKQPMLVLLGMMIAGYVAGAEWGVIYIRAEYPDSIHIIEKEIENLRNLGCLGSNIRGSGISFDFKLIRAQGAYICGEETALLSSIEGQRPEVRIRPPYPVEKGLFNKPTVVNNVETLACLPWIIKEGGEKFSSIGKGLSKGTKLLSLDGFFHRPGIYEVDLGTPLDVVVHDLAGGFKEPIKAMHIGGPLGGLVPVSKTKDLTVDFESFAQQGFLLGHGSVVCIPEDFPLISYLEHLFEFTAHESCGKCFPCRLGSVRGYEMINKSIHSDYKMDRNLMDDLLETLETGSLCALGGGLPLPIKNALQYFQKELNPYFTG